MGQPKQTSSVTPLRAMSRAVSFVAFCSLLLGQTAFAQSASPQPAGTANRRSTASQDYRTTNNAAGFDDETDDTATPATNGTSANADDAQQRPAIPDAQASDDITGSILDDDIRRLNTRETPIDETLPRRRTAESASAAETPGIPIGTFVLRPSVTQSINTETTKDGNTRQRRAFLETDAAATLTSDWGRHQLTVTSEGAWQRNISGEGEEQPSFKVNGDLRLDLSDDTVAHLTAGYNFYREDTDDPEAIANAAQQSDVQEFSAGASVQRDFGILRGTTALALTRSIYSDATLANGTTVELSDRNQTAGTLRGRVGYELSPALIPFIEATIGRSVYDETRDSAGYERSGHAYGAKAGVEVDLGEKLKGEVGVGYEMANFEDSRLSSIDTATLDASLLWSPIRGTDVNLDLQTSIQPSTTAGESGYVSHALTTTVTHQLRDNLVGTMIGGVTWRDYPTDSTINDELVYTAATGLTWNINRYLDLTSTLGYELTTRKEGTDSQQLRAGVGLKLKR
ncbi:MULTISPECIES: outer membrane beta-barrel protein [unclassified Rhizobium]|uniref:outer membrane beta-barrel protein n=1 Tax=unclassified Rhizobium TaxID=2613769 RepID=UPI001A9886E9|nr:MULTISPECIES: outer membrane beta-barrel protein [unclassified Rhizobium]MBX5158618.1 outer membrane beta-barrel protein [Rhizobium sp. NZLR8]MBX5163979.1 outer membrane beta-barrel protein [Rhizobium sp. NZLR4b]MBX5171559.1 outer membrane beta-barrel protein [Rhizobium sp. NZLR1b]MBX5192091.1 outer membrane beta-barrel protein [Rhizobium sp. NZLR3b]MBX5197457.1 outer membrane beta-barrel protein [Rhizobium sp. NZLR10]